MRAAPTADAFPGRVHCCDGARSGWSGTRNGALMRLAETSFDVFITMDRGIEYQQNLAGFKLAVILLRAASNRLDDLLPLVPELMTILPTSASGQLHQVPRLKL
jgi:hypothetical protein